MTGKTYAEWLKQLEKLEREQLRHYAANRQKEGDAVGKQIEQWICGGRAHGFCTPDGRPLPKWPRPC